MRVGVASSITEVGDIEIIKVMFLGFSVCVLPTLTLYYMVTKIFANKSKK